MAKGKSDIDKISDVYTMFTNNGYLYDLDDSDADILDEKPWEINDLLALPDVTRLTSISLAV